MADQQEPAALDDVRRDDPDGERVDNLTLDDLDERAASEAETPLLPTDEVPVPDDEPPVAPEADAAHIETQ